MFNNLCLLLIISIFFQSCKNQSNTPAQTLYNKEFNWTITIPAGFESISPEEWKKMQNKGAEAIKKTYDVEVENNSNTIFVFKSDQFNYFQSEYELFDSSSGESYSELIRNTNEVIYETFEAQMPDASLDSASFEEIIDGKLFQVFKIKMKFPNKM